MLRAAAAFLVLLGIAAVSTMDSTTAADFVGDDDDGFECVSGPLQIASALDLASPHDLVAARLTRHFLAALPSEICLRPARREALSRCGEAVLRSQASADCLSSRGPPPV
jgi:hypothetical protein